MTVYAQECVLIKGDDARPTSQIEKVLGVLYPFSHGNTFYINFTLLFFVLNFTKTWQGIPKL